MRETSGDNIFKELGLKSFQSRSLNKLCTFHKIKATGLPSYLFKLIPNASHHYLTGSVGKISIFHFFLLIYFAITNIYNKKNTSYKFKQKYVCRWPVENQNMFCRQAPLNIDIMSVINFWSLLYDPPAKNMHYRGHCYLNLKLIIIISSIQF